MITKELQQLSDKLTGGHSNDHEISKQVDYIKKNYSGGGSGGGSAFIVHCEGTYESDGENESISYTFDKTPSQVLEAYNAGQIVVFRRTVDQDITRNPTDFYLTDILQNYMIAGSVVLYQGTMTFSAKGVALYYEENEFGDMILSEI